jgi:exodeoxyribonuclease VII large subunit
MLRPAGEGVLFQEFMRLKAQLEAEGLFVPEHKRSIPRWPNCIGVVTSPTGAALRDILNTIRRRYPLVRVVLCPTPVQGDQAPDGIVAALQSLNETVRPDVILLARGGGSIEDLWAFNDERVARAVYNSHVPVVCGVGHETDFTIADFVADLRAPTPTAAAELTTPDKQELLAALQDLTLRMRRAGQVVFLERRRALDNSFRRLNSQSPQKRIRSDRQHIDELIRTANALFAHRLQLLRLQLKANEQKMETLNPLAVLQRGYAILSLPDGQIVRSIEQAHPGDPMNARVADGTFPVEVRRRDYRSISP